MAIAIPPPVACCGPMGSRGTKIWGRHCPTHGERGQSHWRVGWRWLILMLWVVGCGLWVVGCGLWTVGCGLWIMGCGLWVVGCELCCGLESAVSYNTHFVDHPGKQTPPKMRVMKWIPGDSKHSGTICILWRLFHCDDQGVGVRGRPSIWGGLRGIFCTLVSVE